MAESFCRFFELKSFLFEFYFFELSLFESSIGSMMINTISPMSRDDLHTKRWSPSRVDLPVLPREWPSGKIQTRYFPPGREISETNNSSDNFLLFPAFIE